MYADEHNRKNIVNILFPLFFLPPHLTVTHCCHFPARQWHTRVCWALSRVVHWQGPPPWSYCSQPPQTLGCSVLLPQGHGDNFITGNLLLRCGTKQNNTSLINCVNYYISKGKKNLRAIISYHIYLFISNRRSHPSFQNGCMYMLS